MDLSLIILALIIYVLTVLFSWFFIRLALIADIIHDRTILVVIVFVPFINAIVAIFCLIDCINVKKFFNIR
jgi:hypothetical protein